MHSVLKGKTYEEYFGEKQAKEIKEKLKKAWKNPIIREKIIKGIKKSWTKKRRKEQKKRFLKQDLNSFQKKRNKIKKNYKNFNPMSNKKVREKMRQTIINQYKNGRITWNKYIPLELQPMYGHKHTKEAKKKMSLNNPAKRPEIKIKKREITKKLWKDKKYRETITKKIKEFWDNQENRITFGEQRRKWWEEHPEKKKNLIEHMKNNHPFDIPEYRKKHLKSLMKRPTKPEKKLIDWFGEHSLPFYYTGNGDFLIGRKCPDFKHKIFPLLIEYNGFYRHTKQEEIIRTNYFEKKGFKVLFLHKKDLTNKEKTINKINNFCKGVNSLEIC